MHLEDLSLSCSPLSLFDRFISPLHYLILIKVKKKRSEVSPPPQNKYCYYYFHTKAVNGLATVWLSTFFKIYYFVLTLLQAIQATDEFISLFKQLLRVLALFTHQWNICSEWVPSE